MVNFKHKHEDGPTCLACSDPEAARAEHDRIMREHGWIVHYVFDEHGPAGPFLNVHTHGLVEKFGHTDLQICLNATSGVRPGVLHAFLNLLVEQIELGCTYEPGDVVHGIIDGDYGVKLVAAKESGRGVLRVLLPDVAGVFPDQDGCSPALATQVLYET